MADHGATQSRYYHLHQVIIGEKTEVAFFCPQGADKCLHLQFLEEYGTERFPPGGSDSMAKCAFLLTLIIH